MSKAPIAAFAVVFLTPIAISWGQTTSRLEAARLRSKPRATQQAEARRLKQNELMRRDRQPEFADEPDLLFIRPGEYVVAPDKYRPDNWSPLIHPRNDYSLFTNRGGNRIFSQRRRFGSFGPSRFGSPAYSNYAPGYGCYAGGSYGYSPYAGYGDAYIQGRVDSDREYLGYIASQRAGQLLDNNRSKLDEGLELFHNGAYDRAAITLLGAATADGGDAASRVHAGHALFALGKYTEACKLLTRAFELAPHLATSTYDIRDDYGVRDDFDSQLFELEEHLARHPEDAHANLILGYVRFYSQGPSSSLKVLTRARELCPDNSLVSKLYDIAKMTGGGIENHEPQVKRNSVSSPRIKTVPEPRNASRGIRI